MQTEERARRRLPHLPSLEFPNQSIIQFVTVCTDKRRRLLNRRETAQVLIDAWKNADRWLVGRYVIMPDHVHFFCAPSEHPPTPLDKWVSFWRAQVTRQWPYPVEKPIWQRDFFDRQLRSGESYHQKWLYVCENPVRAGLVSKSDEWPFQGELNVLRWHDSA